MAKSEAFDRLTELAAALFDAPTALITVVDMDRVWFRSTRGFEGDDEATREESFCARLMDQPAGSVMIVEDASTDERVRDYPAVADGLRFYAGALITTADGVSDGAVCVIDNTPHGKPTSAQIECLQVLARLAGEEIDKARLARRQAESIAMLEMAETMAGVGHWRYEIATRDLIWSDEVYRIHGLEPGSVVPREHSASDQYHAEDRVEVWALIARAIATGESYDTRLRLTRNGEERVTRARARVELGEDGRPATLFGVFQDITDAIRAQERVERSEALFRLMSETSTDVIARYKPDGELIYLSPAVEAVLGRKAEDLVGRSCREIIHPDDADATFARMAALFGMVGTSAEQHIDYRAIRDDGSIVWLEASPRAVLDNLGRVIEVHDHVRDITARKAAERKQQELVDVLTLAEQLAGVGSWRLEIASGEVRWSDEVYRIHGVSPETFNPSLEDGVAFYHPDDQQAVRDWCAAAIASGACEPMQLRLIRADGEERIVASQCRVDHDEAGQVQALVGVFQDVTASVRSHERVAASEARYRLLADNANDIIAIYGVDGKFTYVSPAIEAVMEFQAEDMIGRTPFEFMHADDVPGVQKAFVEYIDAGPGASPPRVRYRAVTRTGRVVWLEAHPRLIRSEDGQVIEFQDAVREITATKMLEDALIAAKDVAEAAGLAKSEFLANMSHELRTPLTSVIGFSGLLKASENLGDTERRFADRISTSSEALLAVINDILDYSKLEAGAVDLDPRPFEPVELGRSAASIVEQQCQAKGLILRVEPGSDLPMALMGDEGRLRQVMLNFLSNAVKFTVSGEIRLDIGWSSGRMRVAVTDSGIGIPADKIDALFERFTQADASTTRVYGGTGLGLAISRRLIEQMGGEIGATSRPGEGSTFWFEVPLPVAETTGEVEEVDSEGLRPGLRILLADDAAPNRELVRVIVEGWGVHLDAVADGAAAVQAAASGEYDLILMDVHMPVMDGMDATRTIRAMEGKASKIPIVALTANVQPEHIEACRQAGMSGHVGKPIQVAELMAGIAKAVDRRSIPREKAA